MYKFNIIILTVYILYVKIMFHVYVLDLFFSNGFTLLGLNLTVLACIITGILVIIIVNPIVSVLFLIGLFLCISLNLMFLGLNFIGLSYLLVYVGAVTILFLFILMLINIRISEIVSSTRNSIPLAIGIGLLFFSTVYPSIPLIQNYILFIEDNKTDLVSLDLKSFNLVVNNFINNTLIPGLLQFTYSLNGIFNEADKDKDILSLSDTITKDTELNNFYFSDQISNNLSKVYSSSWDINISDSSHIVSLGNILYTSFPILILLTSLVLLLSMVGSIIITVKPLSEPNIIEKNHENARNIL